MSQAENQDPEGANVIAMLANDHHNRRLSSAPLQEESNFGDSSWPLFAMYSNISDEEDNKIAERWQKDAEGIIIFNGLFSAVVAALVVLSVQDLKPNSQDTSAFYLERIYELQAGPNLPRPSTPSPVVRPPAFSPPGYALWVNSLWFLSLVISLTCAMLATLLQQWVRRYIRITQPARCNPEKRARMRAFFANGLRDFHVAWVVEALPGLVHLSLFLFFAGLLVYLFNANHTVFSAVACWVVILLAVYGGVTLMPIFWHNSPYCAPLSSIAWFLYAIILYVVLEVRFILRLRLSTFDAHHPIRQLKRLPRQWISEGVEGAAKESVSKQSSLIQSILNWTIDTIDEDDSLETFFEYIPGFYKSEVVKDLQESLPEEVQSKIFGALIGFLDCTLLSNSLSESLTTHRLAVCLNAAGEIQSLVGLECLYYNVFQYVKWPKVPHSVAIGHFLRSWEQTNDGRTSLYTQAICARIIASVGERNDRWNALATDHLGISKGVLEEYLAQGDTVQLANLTHFTRQLSLSGWELFGTLQRLSGFDIRNTSLGLQREFCALWNEMVQEAQKGGQFNGAAQALSYIHPIHIALHRDPDSVSTASSTSAGSFDSSNYSLSYPLCDIADYPSESIHHIDESSTSEAARSPSSPSVVVQHEYAVLHPADEPSPVDIHASIIKSSHPDPQVFSTSPTAPLYSTAAITKKCTAIRPPLSISSVAGSDLGSTLAATVTIPQPAFSILSLGTDTTQPIVDHCPVARSLTPGTPISPSLIPSPSDTLHTNLRSSSTCATSELDESPLCRGFPTPLSAATPCLTAQTESPMSPLASTSVVDAWQHNPGHCTVTLPVAPETPLSPSSIPRPSDTLPEDLQSRSTCVAPQSDPSPLVLGHPHPDPTSTTPLTAHRDLDRNVALSVPGRGTSAPDDAPDVRSAAPLAAPHGLPSTMPEPDINGGRSSHPVDAIPSHDFGHP